MERCSCLLRSSGGTAPFDEKDLDFSLSLSIERRETEVGLDGSGELGDSGPDGILPSVNFKVLANLACNGEVIEMCAQYDFMLLNIK